VSNNRGWDAGRLESWEAGKQVGLKARKLECREAWMLERIMRFLLSSRPAFPPSSLG